MKYLLIVSVVILGLASNIFSQKTPSDTKNLDNEKSLIMKLESKNNLAIVKGDGKTLATLYSDDYVGIHARGGLVDKKELVTYFSEYGSAMSKSEETKIRIFTNSAIVTAINLYKSKPDDPIERIRYTRVYIKKKGKWQIVSEQYTNVQESDELLLPSETG